MINIMKIYNKLSAPKKLQDKMAEDVSSFISYLGLKPACDGWTMSITLSSVPMENWFYKRNKLKSEDLKLQLIVPSWGNWVAQIDRRDELFLAQWRPNNNFQVESQQIKYRKKIDWPNLENLNDFPDFASKIEKALGIKFLRHANIAARFIDLSGSTATGTNSTIKIWLSPCADSIGEDMCSDNQSGLSAH